LISSYPLSVISEFIPKEETYRRRFWVGVKEQNTQEGKHKIAKRIKSIFDELKNSDVFSDVFSGNEQIELLDEGIAKIAVLL
jgi:type I restriction enzyme M protein